MAPIILHIFSCLFFFLLLPSCQNLAYEIILTLGQAFEVAYQLALQARKSGHGSSTLPESFDSKPSKPVPKPRVNIRKSVSTTCAQPQHHLKGKSIRKQLQTTSHSSAPALYNGEGCKSFLTELNLKMDFLFNVFYDPLALKLNHYFFASDKPNQQSISCPIYPGICPGLTSLSHPPSPPQSLIPAQLLVINSQFGALG